MIVMMMIVVSLMGTGAPPLHDQSTPVAFGSLPFRLSVRLCYRVCAKCRFQYGLNIGMVIVLLAREQ